nr:hypothetical protein [uncultured Blautia sp.]
MKKCPECGEMNGDNNTRCYKCNTFLTTVRDERTFCPKCNHVYYDHSLEICPKCRIKLQEYSADRFGEYDNGKESGGIWMYVLSALIPIVGLIMGFIYLGRREDDIGRRILIMSVVALFVWALIWIIAIL